MGVGCGEVAGVDRRLGIVWRGDVDDWSEVVWVYIPWRVTWVDNWQTGGLFGIGLHLMQFPEYFEFFI